MSPSRKFEAVAADGCKDIDDHTADLHLLILGDRTWFGVELCKVKCWKQDAVAIYRKRIPFQECSRISNDFLGVSGQRALVELLGERQRLDITQQEFQDIERLHVTSGDEQAQGQGSGQDQTNGTPE